MIKITAPLSLVILSTVMLSALLGPATQAGAEETAASLTINRLVVSSAIENREPIDTVGAFPAGTEVAYAFLEATDISTDVEVSFVWKHGESEVGRVILPIRAGSRWRTYSSKKLTGRSGPWRVEVQDSAGATLAAVDFTVE